MPLVFRRNEARLTGNCGAEEALELADWLARRRRAKIDLGGCTHLHAALLHTLLVHRPVLAVAPEDPFLARWIVPALAAARDGA